MVTDPGTDVLWIGDNQRWTIDGPVIDEDTGQPYPGLVSISNEYESERVVRTDELKPFTSSGGVFMKPKCKVAGCYNPADCKHGYCGAEGHCPQADTHRLGGYSTRTYPKSPKRYIGVELEVEFNSERDFKRGVAAYGGHHDASLGEYSAEYKMMRPASTVCRYVSKLAEELYHLKARVTRRCGFHVHIDARRVDEDRLVSFFKWALNTQNHWYKLVPKSRRSNQYASKYESRMTPEAIVANPGSYHHCWIHYSPYSTVEMRLHNGTLNPYKIQGWLTAMVHLQEKLYDKSFLFEKITAGTDGTKLSDKEMFWKVFGDCPQLGREYLLTREQNDGIIRDYAFTNSRRNEEEVDNV